VAELPTDIPLSPKFTAGIDLLRRTGVSSFRVGWTDAEEDGDPVIFHATGTWGRAHYGLNLQRVSKKGVVHECAAGMNPEIAVLRLCEQVIDGGECKHCHKPTIFTQDETDPLLERLGCVYAWDSALSVFRRGCDGD
jgi:hypothetical protein